MFTNQQILDIAMTQSAIDASCGKEDFTFDKNIVVISKEDPRARRYLELPFECNLISYGSNIVASVSEEIKPIAEDYINRFPVYHCFETPNMHILNNKLREKGLLICFMAEYFLPDMDNLKPQRCSYEMKFLYQKDFSELYKKEWSNALCEKRKQLDVLGIGAYDNGKLIGLAGCSADCEDMWQIGIDVLPEYRRRGVAHALTSSLASEVVARGKVPFYCAAWSNIKSVRNALKSGFKPAWVEMTAKPAEFVENINAV